MISFHVFNNISDVNIYILLILIPCLTWVLFFYKRNKEKYNPLYGERTDKLKDNKSTYSIIFRKWCYTKFFENTETKNVGRQNSLGKNALLYYLKRAVYFLNNEKFLNIKHKLYCIFTCNNIVDIRNFRHINHKQVIEFKKDVNSCLLEAYNSFDYRNKKKLLYIYFMIYSKVSFFFKNESMYFFDFITHVLLVSWVYTPKSLQSF